MEVIIAVQGQTLRPLQQKQIVAGSQNFVKISFHFDEEWLTIVDSATNIFAQFVQNGTPHNVSLGSDHSVYLPSEIQAGKCTLTLYCAKDNVVATTKYLPLDIEESGYIEGAG